MVLSLHASQDAYNMYFFLLISTRVFLELEHGREEGNREELCKTQLGWS